MPKNYNLLDTEDPKVVGFGVLCPQMPAEVWNR